VDFRADAPSVGCPGGMARRKMKLERGRSRLVADPSVGSRATRNNPCVIVSDPDVRRTNDSVRRVVRSAAPRAKGALYPPLAPGRSGLRRRSFDSWTNPSVTSAASTVFGRVPKDEPRRDDLPLPLPPR